MAKKLKHYIDKFHSTKFEIENHLYFSLLGSAIFAVHLLHLWIVRETLSFSFIYYAVSAFLQSFIEVILLIFLAKLVRKYGNPKIFNAFVVLTFLLAMIHVVDFPLVRIMDMSIWYVFRFLSHESVESFIEMLLASNVSLMTWFLSIGTGVLIIAASVVFFRYLEKRSVKRPLQISLRKAFSISLVIPSSLLIWNNLFVEFIEDKEHTTLAKVLPWKAIFGQKNAKMVHLDLALSDMKDDHIRAELAKTKLQEKPDIFIFIVESLREDFITEAGCPNISAFKQEVFNYKKAVAGGNATQLSWYSIFYAKPALFWAQQNHERGSYYIEYLKKNGYSINVLSSARLGYYQMDKLLFGNNLQNVDYFECFKLSEMVSSYDADKAAIMKLCEEVKDPEKNGGRLFIVFLDATHFGYSFPKDEPSPFKPCPDSINFVKAVFTKKGMPGVIRRYQNALYFTDKLFGEFVETLKKTPAWENSIIVFTGDHGEEFYEKGHLFHASSLCKEQTRVPLFMKLGTKNPSLHVDNSDNLCSHIDIMPTIFHALQEERFQTSSFYGQSLLFPKRHSYVSFARYNASMNPDEFAIQGEGFKAILKKKKYTLASECKDFRIIELTDEEDHKLDMSFENAIEKIQAASKSLFVLKQEP